MEHPSRPEQASFGGVIAGGAAIGSSVACWLSQTVDLSGTILVVQRDWPCAHASTSMIMSDFGSPGFKFEIEAAAAADDEG